MPKPSYVQKASFAGGLNDSENPAEVKSDQLTAVSNMLPSGHSVEKRKGFFNYPTTQSLATACRGLFELRSRDQGNYHVGLFGDGKAYLYTSGSWTALSGATGLNISATWSAVNSYLAGATNRDALLLTNGKDPVKKLVTLGPTTLDGCDVTTGWSVSAAPGVAPVLNTSDYLEGAGSLDLGGSPTDTIDDCEATTGWSISGTSPSLTLYTALKKRGTGSLRLQWGTGTSNNYSGVFYKSVTAADLTGKSTYVWFYFSDTTDLKSTFCLFLRFGSDASNYYYKSYDRADLVNGWNLLGGDVSAWSAIGSPVLTAIDYIYVGGSSNAGAITSLILMDSWITMSALTWNYTKTIGAVNATGATTGYMNVRVADKTLLNATTALKIYIGSGANDYYHKTFATSALSDGWNQLGGLFTGWTEQGTVNLGALTYLRIDITTLGDYLPVGTIGLDYIYAMGGDAPTWGNLDAGGTLNRAKYIKSFQNYLWLANLLDPTDDSVVYPALLQRSALLDPETAAATFNANTYDIDQWDGYEITGLAEVSGALIVFKERGIHKIDYTGSSSVPFRREAVSKNIGAYHNTVAEGDGFAIFAGPGGVYGYLGGGAVQRLSDPIASTYQELVESAGKTGSLKACYVPATGKYWLACGSGSANDVALVLDVETRTWWKYESAITGFNISYLGVITDSGVAVPWIGLTTGQTLLHGEHYTTAASMSDHEQDGTALDIAASFSTHYFSWSNPPIRKRFLKGNLLGSAETPSSITMSVYPDGKAGVSLGSFNLWDADNDLKTVRWSVHGAAGHGYMFRVGLSESGGSAGVDTRWRVDNLGVEALMLGVR